MFHVEQKELIENILKRLSLSFSGQTMDRLELYHDLVYRTNMIFNLVSEKDTKRIVEHHFTDSLGFAEYLDFSKELSVMDLGSGAGFPGIVLAIVYPHIKMCLVESKRKRAGFLQKVVSELLLDNVEVVCDRAENLDSKMFGFSLVLSRSVAKISLLVKWSSRFLEKSAGCLGCIKGPDVEKELRFLSEKADRYSISGWEVERFDPFPGVVERPVRSFVRIYWK